MALKGDRFTEEGLLMATSRHSYVPSLGSAAMCLQKPLLRSNGGEYAFLLLKGFSGTAGGPLVANKMLDVMAF